MDRIFFRLSLLPVMIFAACNSPMQNKEERAAKDSANAPVQAPATEDVKSVTLDTTYGDYRISAIARGNSSMRDLILAVGSKKDSTQADSTIEKDVKGALKNMMIADLDGNGKPELYLQMLSEGTGQFGKIYAFDIGPKITRINTYSLDTMQQKAYRGQDTFFIKGKTLVRTFPAFRENDPDALTANTRGIIVYHLQKAGDTLKLLPAK
ncbi:hypothetical protein SAMN05660461_0396 [Chitinophaga ginsengisegetis]|uniref:Lysozyme inhibitor of I-type lysozyme n=1 Tax=Chitinophaga ginsengisegetis TaxID=393003 RepID=A0A1T5N4T5_9BACT|nr:hypothetical protein [Chitinophaga ginsengisegetis]SKC95467.1 hypothetical protein SAMN05660461_0396 [Chitinophaga ginsengisegetis]